MILKIDSSCTYRDYFKTAYPKSDNFMPKSDIVKARITKHNLKSKFKKDITFKQTDDL